MVSVVIIFANDVMSFSPIVVHNICIITESDGVEFIIKYNNIIYCRLPLSYKQLRRARTAEESTRLEQSSHVYEFHKTFMKHFIFPEK